MAEAYDVVQGRDGRVLVILHPGSTIARESILELLTEAGIDAINVSFIDLAAAVDEDADGRCILVPIDEVASDDPELADAARRCAQSASGVVVVFGEGFEFPGLHPIASGYGTQCRWSPDELRPLLPGGGGSEPRNTDGTPVERPRPTQVNCR